jgi:hypothetical protein
VKEDGAIYGSIPDSATDDKMMRRQWHAFGNPPPVINGWCRYKDLTCYSVVP